MPKAVAVIAGFDDMAVMGQAVQQCEGHLGVTEHGRPFRESEIGGDKNADLFVDVTDQVKEQGAAGLTKRQIS